MGTRFFYREAKTYIDPTMDQLARQFRKLSLYFQNFNGEIENIFC